MAFTLIEVLVVVAIIALLVAILIPALSRVRAQARMTVCTSNGRQMGMGAHLFATEYKDRIPRGLSRGADLTGRITWVTMILRRFGDRKNYSANFNRAPVENFEVFTCPQRTDEYGGAFLDYVVNSMDHRGPLDNLTSCQPDPAGIWYEAQGVTKLNIWDRPSEVVYITDAVEESWNVNDGSNSWGTMKRIRENIETTRAPSPPTETGIDWFDVAGGAHVPIYRDLVDTDRRPRAALKMHLDRGSTGAYVDGHVELIKPPRKTVGTIEIQKFYYRKFGVDPEVVPYITATDTTASSVQGDCTAGDTFWQPGQ